MKIKRLLAQRKKRLKLGVNKLLERRKAAALRKENRQIAKRHENEKQHYEKAIRQKINKISWRRKLVLSFNVIAVLVLFYFVVLTSIGPKSIPFITNKIAEVLRTNLGATTSIKNSYIKFTASGLRLSVIGLEVPYSVSNSLEQKIFTVPQIDAEFSLLKMMMLNFYPRRVKASGLSLVIDSSTDQQVVEKNSNDPLAMIVQLLSAIKTNKLPIKSCTIIAKGSLEFFSTTC
jgi:hypothetical protein